MKKTFAILALALSAFAQAGDPAETAGVKNGRYWLTLSVTSKAFYLLGFWEGIVLSDRETAAQFSGGRATGGERMKGLDQFYSDAANVRIPIVHAMRIFVLKLKGVTDSEVDIEVAAMRKTIDNIDRENAQK